MNPSSKDKMIVVSILIVFLLVVSGVAYTIFAKPKTAGMITMVTKIVNVDNIDQIALYKKHSNTYAIKVQENNISYLRYFSYDNSVPYESKYDLTTDQYNKLVDDKEYWFNVDFAKTGDRGKGIIKKIYTENPVR
jgi:hypothetical protein